MNKKQKKTMIIGSSATLAIVLAVGATVGIYFAIDKTSNGGVQEVTFYSNLDFYNDAGFNEATYKGVESYGSKNHEEIGIQTSSNGYHTYGKGSQYVEDLIRIFNDATYVVSSGSNVAEVMLGTDEGNDEYSQLEAQEEFKKEVIDNNEKSFILLDDTDSNVAKFGNENFVSISYAAEEVGFLAGVSAALYSTYISETKGKETIDNYVTLWGGIEFPTIAFLSGFEQAVNWFNYAIFGIAPLDISTGNIDISMDYVKITPSEPLYAVDYSQALDEQKYSTGTAGESGIAVNDISAWYTGDFNKDAGKPDAANAISRTKAADGDVNVIFPVAGGQTGLAINNIFQENTKVIGVDTDAEISYSENKDLILGSATKELESSAEYSIWYEKEFKLAYEKAQGNLEGIDSLTYEQVKEFVENPDNGMSDSAYIQTEEEYNSAYKFAAVYDPSLEGENRDKQGWNQTISKKIDLDGVEDTAGSSFYGNVSNGGVGFTTTNNFLQVSLDALLEFEVKPTSKIDIDGFTGDTVNEFLEFSYNEQEFISSYSMTFSNYTSNLIDNDNMNQVWRVVYFAI